jgi:DNA repair protein RadC
MDQTRIADISINRFDNIDISYLSGEERNSAIDLAGAILRDRFKPGALIDSPMAISDYLLHRINDFENEVFGVVYLSTSNTVIGTENLFNGTIDGASVYPRVIVQRALQQNAASVILFHNHPSGNLEASQADRQITKRLTAALNTVDIRVLDHLIVSGGKTLSFSERGLI